MVLLKHRLSHPLRVLDFLLTGYWKELFYFSNHSLMPIGICLKAWWLFSNLYYDYVFLSHSYHGSRLPSHMDTKSVFTGVIVTCPSSFSMFYLVSLLAWKERFSATCLVLSVQGSSFKYFEYLQRLIWDGIRINTTPAPPQKKQPKMNKKWWKRWKKILEEIFMIFFFQARKDFT